MKRSEQIVELMDDVKKIISQMAVVDVCEEEKPVEVGKTIMTSREVADMFQEYHSVTYRRIAQLIVELEPMEQTEFKMAQFKARHQEYPMWELFSLSRDNMIDKILDFHGISYHRIT